MKKREVSGKQIHAAFREGEAQMSRLRSVRNMLSPAEDADVSERVEFQQGDAFPGIPRNVEIGFLIDGFFLHNPFFIPCRLHEWSSELLHIV